VEIAWLLEVGADVHIEKMCIGLTRDLNFSASYVTSVTDDDVVYCALQFTYSKMYIQQIWWKFIALHVRIK
jgi:hypothetical protein